VVTKTLNTEYASSMPIDKGKPEISGKSSLVKQKHVSGHGSESEGVDDILEAVVRSATSDHATREKRRARAAADTTRKSCTRLQRLVYRYTLHYDDVQWRNIVNVNLFKFGFLSVLNWCWSANSASLFSFTKISSTIIYTSTWIS